MPELCEVQIMTENLERWMVGQRVVAIEVVELRGAIRVWLDSGRKKYM